jgi:hypothetical protein
MPDVGFFASRLAAVWSAEGDEQVAQSFPLSARPFELQAIAFHNWRTLASKDNYSFWTHICIDIAICSITVAPGLSTRDISWRCTLDGLHGRRSGMSRAEGRWRFWMWRVTHTYCTIPTFVSISAVQLPTALTSPLTDAADPNPSPAAETPTPHLRSFIVYCGG